MVQAVTCGLLVVVVLSTMVMAESSASERRVDDAADTAAAVDALVRALRHYRRPVVDLATKREAALDVDYGWGGGRFGKRRMADRVDHAVLLGRPKSLSVPKHLSVEMT